MALSTVDASRRLRPKYTLCSRCSSRENASEESMFRRCNLVAFMIASTGTMMGSFPARGIGGSARPSQLPSGQQTSNVWRCARSMPSGNSLASVVLRRSRRECVIVMANLSCLSIAFACSTVLSAQRPFRKDTNSSWSSAASPSRSTCCISQSGKPSTINPSNSPPSVLSRRSSSHSSMVPDLSTSQRVNTSLSSSFTRLGAMRLATDDSMAPDSSRALRTSLPSAMRCFNALSAASAVSSSSPAHMDLRNSQNSSRSSALCCWSVSSASGSSPMSRSTTASSWFWILPLWSASQRSKSSPSLRYSSSGLT
mmetsp:Transcript_1338/g.2343  ORF Transcript_1338/g.2343 Transcript_1338/m.2343 type:complete len:311 (-) Transcript_1338:496-1428(-)